MKYTKAELIAAYCEANNCEPAELKGIKNGIQELLDLQRADLQESLDALPVNASEKMKLQALKYLADKAESQALIDNSSIDF